MKHDARQAAPRHRDEGLAIVDPADYGKRLGKEPQAVTRTQLMKQSGGEAVGRFIFQSVQSWTARLSSRR
jgi:hypothetical protein